MIVGSVYVNAADDFKTIKTVMAVKEPGLSAWRVEAKGNNREAAVLLLKAITENLKDGKVPFGRRVVILLDLEPE